MGVSFPSSLMQLSIHNWIHIPRVRSVRQKIFNALTLAAAACALHEVFCPLWIVETTLTSYRFHEDENETKKNFFAFLTDFQISDNLHIQSGLKII